MAEEKKSFIAYTDWKGTFEALPDNKAGQLIKHIFRYVSGENPKTDDILINAVFANIQNTLNRDSKKWEKQQKQRIEAGKRSAELRKRNSTTVERPLNESKQASTVSVNDSVSVSVSDSVNIKKDINKIPAFDEFKKHAISKEPMISEKHLKLKYDSWIENDWKDGNDKPIKNWKSKLTNTIAYIQKKSKDEIDQRNNGSTYAQSKVWKTY